MTKTLVEASPTPLGDFISALNETANWLGYEGHTYEERQCREAAGALKSSASRIEELERALKPFAEAGATLSSRWEDHETHWQDALSCGISAGQLRAARSALSDKG